MRIYVINLDRSEDRLKHVSAQLARAGLTFARFAAIDGWTALPEPGQESLPAGHLGCARSHQALWTLIADGPDEWAVVLEDDVFVSTVFKAFLAEITKSGLEACDIVKFETNHAPVCLSQPFRRLNSATLHWLRTKHGGTAGYAIRRTSARMLLEKTTAFPFPIDFIFHPGRIAGLRVLQAVPAMVEQVQCSQSSLPSTIDVGGKTWISHRPPLGLAAKLRRKAFSTALQIGRWMRGDRRQRVPLAGVADHTSAIPSRAG